MKFLQYINEATNSKVFNQLNKQFDLYLQKLAQLTNPTNQEYCDLLTSVYYPIVAYRFEPTETINFYDFMMNGTITLCLNSDLLKPANRKGQIEQNPIFVEIIKMVDQAFDLIKNIDRLKVDLAYLSNVQVIQYLQNNIDIMARKAGSELSVYGGTKIDALYACVFGEKSELCKSISDLIGKYTIKMNEEYATTIDSFYNTNRSSPIYKNPTYSDFKQLNKECKDHIFGSSGLQVRFLVDTITYDLYIWDAYSLIHNDFTRKIETSNILYAGIGFVKNNKIDVGDVWERTNDSNPNPTYYLADRWKTEKYDKLKQVDKYFVVPLTKMLVGYYKPKQRHIGEAYVENIMPVFGKVGYDVFKNPTNKELFAATDNEHNTCRFVIDVKNADIYIWDYKLLHRSVANQLGFDYPTTEEYIYGEAEGLQGNKLKKIVLYDFVADEKSMAVIKTLGWVKKYFSDRSGYVEKSYKIDIKGDHIPLILA